MLTRVCKLKHQCSHTIGYGAPDITRFIVVPGTYKEQIYKIRIGMWWGIGRGQTHSIMDATWMLYVQDTHPQAP